jgi:DNA-binding transcriptional LysR family regulator
VLSGSDALTVLPYSVVFLTRKAMGLEALRLRIEHPDRQLGMLTHDGATPPPALRQFAGFLTDEFALLEARIQHESQVTQRRG